MSPDKPDALQALKMWLEPIRRYQFEMMPGRRFVDARDLEAVVRAVVAVLREAEDRYMAEGNMVRRASQVLHEQADRIKGVLE